MRPLTKGAALFVAVACAVWILVLWRWRAAPREMDGGDLLLYLVVLPATVFALLLALRWAVRGALARQQSAAAGSSAAAAAHAADGGDAHVVSMPWHLLGAWVHTAGGTSVQELLSAIEAGDPRPSPDAELQDDDGLPVMTARIAGLDTAEVEGALQRLGDAKLATFDGAAPFGATPERALRALAILSPLVDDLVRSLLVWSGSWAEEASALAAQRSPSPTSISTSTSPPAGPGNDPKIIRVLASWPTDWDDATCAAAEAWLTERLCEPLATELPPARWSIRSQRLAGHALLTAAEHTLDLLRRQGRDDPVALIACHSDLDADGIRAVDARQSLFHATRRPKVAMAGEGAAVLVLSATPWPADAVIETGHVRLMSPVAMRRAQSIESAGRAATEDTVSLVRRALAQAGVPGAAVARLVSDADQHTARATELFAVTLALMPELDAEEDLRLAGTLAGRLEAVAPLLTVACAAVQAHESGKPAVALSLADPHWRMAAVLIPETYEPVPVPAPG